MSRRTSQSPSDSTNVPPRRRSTRTSTSGEPTDTRRRGGGGGGGGGGVEGEISTRGPSSTSTTSRPPAASPQASLGVGRPSRGAQGRRSSRRASLDPYQVGREESPETARRPRSNRVEEVEEKRNEEKSTREEVPTSPVPQEAEGSGSSEVARGKNFRLRVMQQPEIGAEAGLGKVTLGRLPIIPAPVVQVIVTDESGQPIDVELPYLFCSCSLRGEDGVSRVDLASPPVTRSRTATRVPPSTSGGDEEFSALVGNLVRNPHKVQDLDGNDASVFVFEDMSVRSQGRFTLEFRLGEARRPKSPKLAAVVSEPFDVVEWKNYPGRPAADTITPLSMHLHNQGVPIYIPPLVLSTPSDHPPPPGSNPFPPDDGGHGEDEAGGDDR